METTLTVGDRVESGTPGTDDYDTGIVDRIDGDQVTVRWDSLVVTTQRADGLRKLPRA